MKVLFVEDSSDDVMLIERELIKSGLEFSSSVVYDQTGFEKALDGFRPDVILCDHRLPGFSFVDAFEIYKTHQRKTEVHIPFILVTGSLTEDFALESIESGVYDYVLKDRLKRLPFAIQNALEKCRIKNERLQYLRQLMTKEALMSEAEELANLGSWQVDIRTGKHTWSDTLYSIYGFEPGEVEPGYEAFFSLAHPEDREALRSSLEKLLGSGSNGCGEFRLVDNKGNLKFIMSKVKLVRDSAGKPSRLLGFSLDITERKKAQIALEEKEQEFRSLFEQNPDAIISLDANANFTNVNDGIANLSGYSKEELMQMKLSDFFHPDNLQRIYDHFARSLEGNPQKYEARFMNSRGVVLLVDVTNIPIIVNNHVIGVHIVAKDVSGERKLENLLEEVYRQSRIGAWELDVRTEKLSWNAITKELCEVDSDFEPRLETAILFYKKGKNRDSMRKAMESGMKHGMKWDLELQITTGKGNERWVRSMGGGEMKNGKCIRLFGTLQDIHDRKSAEVTLQEAFAERTRILESIGDGFFAVDKRWVVTYWNKHAENLLRMPRESVVGRNLWEANAVPLEVFTQFQKAMQENLTVHFEEYYASLELWLQVSAYPSASGLSIYFKDVTEQKKSIQELAEQNERLKEIGWLQSHELRGPIARILGLVYIINRGMGVNRELPALLTSIESSATELDKVVQKIVRKTEIPQETALREGRTSSATVSD